jgi:hypothetical protein
MRMPRSDVWHLLAISRTAELPFHRAELQVTTQVSKGFRIVLAGLKKLGFFGEIIARRTASPKALF